MFFLPKIFFPKWIIRLGYCIKHFLFHVSCVLLHCMYFPVICMYSVHDHKTSHYYNNKLVHSGIYIIEMYYLLNIENILSMYFPVICRVYMITNRAVLQQQTSSIRYLHNRNVLIAKYRKYPKTVFPCVMVYFESLFFA